MKSKSVLMFFPWIGTHPQDAFAGVRGDAAARHWDFYSAETMRADDGVSQLHRSSRSAASISGLIELLRPDGIIVWEDALSPSEVFATAGDAVPTVFVDCGAEVDAVRRLRVGRVHNDPGSIAAIAARTLLSSGYGDFAFVPNGVPLTWSVERGKAFEHCIDVAGKRFHRFERPLPAQAHNPGMADEGDRLERWLETLPKPCGIFAANDAVGEEVLGACGHLGIAVPDKVAVIGVDNHEYFCEATTPTLSSIALDLRAEGRAAMELLEAMLSAPRRKPATRFIAARAAVLRASTRYARDRRVARALEFIRLNACDSNFGPRDVVREMGVSRTLADILFRKTLGQTILDEIHAVRLDRAKELLATGIAPDVVGAECGYASHDDFRRVFRKRVGTTIRKWMLSHTF